MKRDFIIQTISNVETLNNMQEAWTIRSINITQSEHN
jgi:hypothetical protein